MSRQENGKQDSGAAPVQRRRVRTWTIIQWVLIPILLIAALCGGLITGYVVLGHKELSDVFHWSTWKHVYDLVFAP